ncbi:myosin-IIIb isoform X3 [Nematostella vectensis]|uniref:myosin-IIIb isoform X3 n=1 Tax=Nematostella vectensis TaxID=45351 RepID=UPI00139016BA|nr:myosin-IIIb isoform X3 [Nematostella vectensis]
MLSYRRADEIFAVMGKGAESLRSLDPPVDWQLVESIGEGTYGEVYKVRNVKTGEIAAAKVIDSILEKIEEVLPELEILKKFSDHPNIAGFHGAFIQRDPNRQDQLWLVMELCRGGSVTNLVKNLIKKGKSLEEDLVAYILHETLKGVEYLHRKNVMHRDIKGANVMLTNEADIRLIDFGVSSELTNALMKKNSSVGTPFWMAPEVIACEQQLDYSYDMRCDVWSIGITGIELADGVAPLSDEHPMRALFKIPRNKPPTMKHPEKWSHEYRDFIAHCLIKDFEERPFVSQLLQHPFLNWVPTKKLALRRKLMTVMDSLYQGRDGIMDEIAHERRAGARDLASPPPPGDPKRNNKMLQVNDLASLSTLTEEIILSHLLERFMANRIYTYIGDILIAVNPLQTLNIYGEEHSRAYRNAEKSSLPPHLYMVADMTYQAMIHNNSPQCLLISGESGAGKTVSANYLVQHLADLGRPEIKDDKVIKCNQSETDSIEKPVSDNQEDETEPSADQQDDGLAGGNKTLEEKILQVNPLMEALGNAQTVINDNSSRFGKFLELHFTSNGALIGAKLSEYLLEKSRIVFQSSDERNFHIFYYMIAGLAHQKKLEKYSFKLYSQHNYLQTGGRNLQDVVCTLGNRKRFEEVQRCFDVIGFTHDEVSSLLAVLAAIIHMGDIVFTEDESVSHLSDKSMVSNPQVLVIVSSLLNLNAVELRDALTTNSNVTRGETIIRNNTVEQAVDCRDAMAKALYGSLFSWIVQRMNVLLRQSPEEPIGDHKHRIGILDIFGFENFTINSFEQLCINIANEQIQFYFNQQIFSWELDEYREEGIPLHGITFEDNRPILDMFLQKPIGVLALLDEESRFPKATDFTLVEKFNNNIKQHCYERTKETENFPSFTIKHYAGRVKYNATNFLEKNRDTLSPDVVHVLRTSENRLVRTLINQKTKDDVSKTANQVSLRSNQRASSNKLVTPPDAKLNSSSNSKINQTVSVHFRYSLKDLLSKLLPSQSHFVRCIRPNGGMVPGKFDQEMVLCQLRYTGVLETTRIRKQGFSERLPFDDFVKRYKVIGFPMHKPVRSNGEACRTILKAARLDKWRMGKTKVFLKYYHVEKLGKMLEDYRVRVVIVQKVVRGWLARRRYTAIKEKRHAAALEIQKVYRGHVARKRYRAEVERQRQLAMLMEEDRLRRLRLKEEERRKDREAKAAVTIQAATRGYFARKEYKCEREKMDSNARMIQSVFRGHQVRKDLHKLKEDIKREDRARGEKVKAAIKIQSRIRGNRARKHFHELQEEAEKNETQSLFFFQQVIDSSSRFFDRQRRQRKFKAPIEPDPNKQHFDPVIGHRHIRSKQGETPLRISMIDELDEIGSQQETQRLIFLQQAEKSWNDFVKRLETHVPTGPIIDPNHWSPSMVGVRVLPQEEGRRETQFSIRPRETSYSDIHTKSSHRSERSFRKELWSAADEAYLRHFADDNKRDVVAMDGEQRVKEMMLLVDGLPSDAVKDPAWLQNTSDSENQVSRTRRLFEWRPPSPSPNTEADVKESSDDPPLRQRTSSFPVEINSTYPPRYASSNSPSAPSSPRTTASYGTATHLSSTHAFSPAKKTSEHSIGSFTTAAKSHGVHGDPTLLSDVSEPFQSSSQRSSADKSSQLTMTSDEHTRHVNNLRQIPRASSKQPARTTTFADENPVNGLHTSGLNVIIDVDDTNSLSLDVTQRSQLELPKLRPRAWSYTSGDMPEQHTSPGAHHRDRGSDPHNTILYSHALKKTGRMEKLLGITDRQEDDVTRVNFTVPLAVS